MASSLRKAQVPIRGRGGNKCPHHAGKEVILVCKDCGDLVCSKCMSTIHAKHAVDDINKIIPQIKVTIQEFVNKAEKRYIPEINGELKSLSDKMSKNKNHFKDVIFRITKQNENLKRELDKVTNNLIALCREVEKGNEDILKRHRMELQSKNEELNARLLELKNTLQSGTNIQMYDTSREIPSDFTIPALSILQGMDFTPTSFSLIQLEKLVGEVLQITGDSRTQIKSSVVLVQERTDVAHESEKQNFKRTQPQMLAKKDRSSDNQPSSNVGIFIKFQLFTHEKRINSICATPNSQVWVTTGKELELLNNAGETQKIMKMGVYITDICVSPSTGDIWFCSFNDGSLRKVNGNNRSTVMFNIESEPVSICIPANGNILVGMKRQIVKYTQHGQILCTSTQTKQVPVVRHPHRIGSCPVTRNIAVVDLDYKTCGGDDKKHILILSEDLRLLYRYYGQDIKSFCPRDVCYSDTGDMYITDYDNRSIQQISGRGKFLQTVYTDSDKLAYYLSVQSNGDIWAVFGGVFNAKNILILQKESFSVN